MESLIFYLSLFKWGLFSGLLFATSSAFVSSYLILQRNSLFPHAITHILFLSLFILSLITAYLPLSLHFPFLVLITLFIGMGIFFLIRYTQLYDDTATSLITYLSLALALIIASKTSKYDATLLNYLFGSLIVVSKREAFESVIVFLISVILYLKFNNLWLSQTVEREVPGISYKYAQLLLLFLIILQTIVGIKLMGVLLVPAFFVYSGVLALIVSPNFKWVFPLNVFFNILALLIGFLISIFFDLPFSASVILFYEFLFNSLYN